MLVKPSFFKFRGYFDFSPHRYDIGRYFAQNKFYADNFFCLKIYDLDESEFDLFYNYQLNFFVLGNPGMEEAFFIHVQDIVNTRISYFRQVSPFSPRYQTDTRSRLKLQAFLKFLETIDKWNHHKSLETVIAEKEEQIQQLKAENKLLEDRLQELHQYETTEKIRIVEGKLGTAIDLFVQLQELTLPDGRTLLKSQAQSPWYKLLSKYFSHGENEIPINTARNYFPAQRNMKLIKGSEVQEEDKFFRIISIKH